MKKIKLTIIILALGIKVNKAQHFIESAIWIAEIIMNDANIYFGAAKNATNIVGYNSQPVFINDSTMLYTHIGQDLQADIYQYHISKKTNTKFTNTKESEYSAKLLPNKNGISVVEVEQDSTQRIWAFDKNGKNGKVYASNVDSVGYYTWINDSTFAAFILTEPPSLQICNTKNNKTKIIETNVGRCLQVNNQGNLYFTKLENDSVRWLCRTESNGNITKLIEFYKGVEDFVISNNNVVICAKNGIIYYSDNQFNLGWRFCSDFSSYGVNQINRLALSPDNKKIAMVNITNTKK